MLDILLALNRERRRIIDFEVDEAFDVIAFAVPRHGFLPVLIYATDKVFGNA
jgi:hypothetical protein